MKALGPDDLRVLREQLLIREQQLHGTLGHEQLELEAVHAALVRIDCGTFGRCLSCGAHIPMERLEVQAEAILCHVCHSRAEAHLNSGYRTS